MGIAAKLFHNPEDRENTLSYRVRPSDEQVQEQRDRWNDLAEYLKERIREKSGKPVSSWLQGSYKFGTQIRPAQMNDEFDIDLGIYVEWQGGADEGGIGPKELKDWVQGILEDYAEDDANEASEASAPKARCNRIRFSEDFHIDVPSYHLERDYNARDLATEDDGWENSDPKAIYIWWKKQFEDGDRDRARRLTRYLKMWAALTFENESRPSSVLLTVLVAKALKYLDTVDLSGDDEYFQAVVKTVNNRIKRSSIVLNPVNPSENLNRLTDEDVEKLKDELENLLSVADRALAAVDEFEGADIWTEVFKHFFPFPKEETVSKATDSSRGDITVVRHDPDVLIVATSGKRRWKGLNGIGPVPRGCNIEFEIANPEILPDGVIVSWTVRNEGVEAEAVNDLGHVAGVGLKNSESSAYRGSHFMDVVVKLNGGIIGRRRLKVEVSGLGLPIRNPKRPAWTRLR